MAKTKKICVYSVLSSGHLNLCISLASTILDNHPECEVYFIVDAEWQAKLAKADSRFKFGVIDYDNTDSQNRIMDLIQKFEQCLELPLIDRTIQTWRMFLGDMSILEIDRKSAEKIREIGPDILLCDQPFHLPSMHSTGVRTAFIVSANPLLCGIPGFPKLGSDASVDDKAAIKWWDEQIGECSASNLKFIKLYFEKLAVPVPAELERLGLLDHPLSDETFTIYAYPAELEYYNEAIRAKYRLWQIDSPICERRIPKPFQMPKAFEEQPGKIVYVSLGSLFSIYLDKMQRLVDSLERIANVKFIISKGSNGDKLRLPNDGRFWGENYVDQLAVLQIADLAILHGGNNSFCEGFHLGVPMIILRVFGDQINNAKRLEETAYGYQLDIMKYTAEQMADTVNKALNDGTVKENMRKASARIRSENQMVKIAKRIADFIDEF